MRPDAIVHNFQDSLNQSLDIAGEADWVLFYREVWPELLAIVRVDADSDLQRSGTDRIIWLPNRRQITIDEKCRKKDYRDIALELSHGDHAGADFKAKTHGWATDLKKQCDFVAYAIPASKKCYLLPLSIVRLAIRRNLDQWKARSVTVCNQRNSVGIVYPIDAPNEWKGRRWTTRNICVTWDVLGPAIMSEMERSRSGGIELPPSRIVSGGKQLEFDWSK